jgi:hypothetical protein
VKNQLLERFNDRCALASTTLDFDRTSNLVDGVLRTSVRGWYTFTHLGLALSWILGAFHRLGGGALHGSWMGLVLPGMRWDWFAVDCRWCFEALVSGHFPT